MANLPATQTECTDTSDELIQLLVSFVQDIEAHDTGDQSNNMTSLMYMLNAPPYVEGIINLHGKMIPIISLRN
jgi:purine-binding chemotaxis protein CheW